MGNIYVDDIEVRVSPYQERTATLQISGLPGTGTESYCQIVLSSLTIYHSPPPGSLIPIGYKGPDGQFVNTYGDPERVLVDASITSARLSPGPVTTQFADFGPNVSSASLSNAVSVTFKLHVKTTTTESVYARASIAVHTKE